MTPRVRAAGAAMLVAVLAPHAASQSLAARVSAVRDGVVLLSFAGRPGLCGDGANMIWPGDRAYSFGQGFGRMTGVTRICNVGPVQVTISRAGGETATIRVRVGRLRAPASDETSLGAVPASEAAAYFFSEARAGAAERNSRQALVAAVLADSTRVTAPLLKLIHDGAARVGIRQFAAMLLGDADEPDARAALREVIQDERVTTDVRGSAIIALGQGNIDRSDAEFLEARYPSLPASLHDKVFLALSRSDDPRVARWLGAKVLDSNESMETRKQALFWAGQGSMPIAELAGLYDTVESRELREHFTFVLSQRHEEQAIDKLIDVVTREKDKAVRNQALFWLGQSREPKARGFLRDLILREDHR